APQMEEDAGLAHVLDGTLPVVSLHHVPGYSAATVTADDEMAGYLATKHLLDRGHRMIAMVTGPAGRRATQDRIRGYERAVAGANVHSAADLVEDGGVELRGAEAAVLRLFRRKPGITAVFAHSDVMAIGALRALRSLGKAVPEDCSVVGCD